VVVEVNDHGRVFYGLDVHGAGSMFRTRCLDNVFQSGPLRRSVSR
jgi:hypothetical protein